MRQVQANALCIVAISVAFACMTVLVRPVTILGRVVESFDSIPREVGSWTGHDADTAQSERLLPNSSVLMRDYVNDSGRWANLTIVYGLDVADIHKPEYCFEGQGWSRISEGKVTITPSDDGKPHSAKLLVLRDAAGGKVVCIYWYAGPSGAKDSLAGQRFEVWKDAILSGKVRPSALVRVMSPVVDDEALAKQEALWIASDLDASICQMVSRQPYITRARRKIGE